MKGRIIKSVFWESRVEKKYSPTTAYFYLYLLSCKHIGLTPYFKLPEDYIPFETGLNKEQIGKAKTELEAKHQVFFYDNWVFIVNADEHNSYKSSPKTRVAYEAQLAEIPSHVLEHFNSLSIGYTYPTDRVSQNSENGTLERKEDQNQTNDDRVSIEYPYSMDTHNNSNNSDSSNNNKGGVGGNEASKVLAKWNEVHGTNYKSTASIETNLKEWLKEYSFDDILRGIEMVAYHHYWRDKMNPTIYLRRGNPRGERVDWIGEMLNYKPKKGFANEAKPDKYDD